MLTITLSICLVHECIVSQDRQSCEEKRFWYHPRCKSLSLTHSCFSNDLIVFVEGSKQSIEGPLSVFEEFSVWSYWRSVWRNQQFTWLVFLKKWSSILTYFPFAEGDLPVKYLGLPLLTKGMKKKDYLPLTEKIRARITTWQVVIYPMQVDYNWSIQCLWAYLTYGSLHFHCQANAWRK